MTIRLSSFAFALAAGLAATASADVIGRDSGPPRGNEASASHYLFLLHVVNVEREKEAARRWLSKLSPEEREETLGGIVRSLGELAGHFNELVAKAAAPETREDVLVLLAEEICRRREWVIAYDELRRRAVRRTTGPDGPGRRRPPPAQDVGVVVWEEDWWEPEEECPRLEEMKISDGRMREPRDVGNVFLLRLLAMERRRQVMRRWLSELSPEDRSEMMARGTRWLAGVTDHLDELAAKAATPETREDVFVLIAQKRCEGLAFSFSSSGPFDSPSWSPWCGYGRTDNRARRNRNPERGDTR